MRKSFCLVPFAAVLLFAMSPAKLQSQTYSINWQTVDGGGGTSTGGVYAVSGTIGQSDAGTMSGGGYSLTGGFWVPYAAPAPGPPPLLVLGTGVTVGVMQRSPLSPHGSIVGVGVTHGMLSLLQVGVGVGVIQFSLNHGR